MKKEAFQLPDNFSLVCKSQPEAELFRKWDPGDEPYEVSLKIEECPIRILKARRLPSFRAMLHHKLKVIALAYGSLTRAATKLKVSQKSMADYMKHGEFRANRRPPHDKIDREYAIALEVIGTRTLADSRSTRRKLTKKQKDYHARINDITKDERSAGDGRSELGSEWATQAPDEAGKTLRVVEGGHSAVHSGIPDGPCDSAAPGGGLCGGTTEREERRDNQTGVHGPDPAAATTEAEDAPDAGPASAESSGG